MTRGTHIFLCWDGSVILCGKLFSCNCIRATIDKDDPFGKRASACSCLIHDTFFNSVGLAVHFV